MLPRARRIYGSVAVDWAYRRRLRRLTCRIFIGFLTTWVTLKTWEQTKCGLLHWFASWRLPAGNAFKKEVLVKLESSKL